MTRALPALLCVMVVGVGGCELSFLDLSRSCERFCKENGRRFAWFSVQRPPEDASFTCRCASADALERRGEAAE